MTQQSSQDGLDARVQESLSALMDNEADDLELRRILNSCEQQPELAATWASFHLVHSVLQGNSSPVSKTLSERIAAQIAEESLPTSVSQKRFADWQLLLGKVGVAASVAIVFVLAMPAAFSPYSTPALVSQEQMIPVISAPTVAAPQLAVETTTPVMLDPHAQQRLSDYLERVTFKDDEPVITVHIQNSPLYRLVNELGSKPQ